MTTVQHATVIGATGIAAYTDTRFGKIPNVLTLPLIGFGVLLVFIAQGTDYILDPILGIIGCGIVPAMMFNWRIGKDSKRAMYGGDVKLFAAIGSLAGLMLGIEILFFSMSAAALGAIAVLIKRRRLLASLGNMFFLAFNRLLPEKKRRDVHAELQDPIRIGPFIFIGTIVAVVLRHPEWLG
ncbi:MAG: A24 family peptidase [Myxococcota bacterium]